MPPDDRIGSMAEIDREKQGAKVRRTIRISQAGAHLLTLIEMVEPAEASRGVMPEIALDTPAADVVIIISYEVVWNATNDAA